jgi:hypothetical protein
MATIHLHQMTTATPERNLKGRLLEARNYQPRQAQS